MVNFTSSAVSLSPLWKVTPLGRVINRPVLLSVHSKERASLGLNSNVVGSW